MVGAIGIGVGLPFDGVLLAFTLAPVALMELEDNVLLEIEDNVILEFGDA